MAKNEKTEWTKQHQKHKSGTQIFHGIIFNEREGSFDMTRPHQVANENGLKIETYWGSGSFRPTGKKGLLEGSLTVQFTAK